MVGFTAARLAVAQAGRRPPDTASTERLCTWMVPSPVAGCGSCLLFLCAAFVVSFRFVFCLSLPRLPVTAAVALLIFAVASGRLAFAAPLAVVQFLAPRGAFWVPPSAASSSTVPVFT